MPQNDSRERPSRAGAVWRGALGLGLATGFTVFGAGQLTAAGAPRMMAMTALNKPVIPARGADGAFRTINYGIDTQRMLWHVRAALNVAALGCEDEDRKATIASYNRFLTSAKAPLDAANRSIVAGFKAQYGAGWTAQYDLYMTSLYNFFSQPFVKTAFCAAAHPIAGETAAVTAQSATAFAASALPRLEAPFTDFYKRYAAYELAMANYNDRYAGGRAPGAPPPPVSPLLDYAALDLGDAWQPGTSAAPRPAPARTASVSAVVPVHAPAPMPTRMRLASAMPAPARYATSSFAVETAPRAASDVSQRVADATPAPALDYRLPN